METTSIWDRIQDLPLQVRNAKKALIYLLEDEYDDFDIAAFLLSKYIIKTGFGVKIGRYNIEFLKNKEKYEDYKLSIANNLLYWARKYYPLLKWYNMAWGKIQAEILRAYDCLCKYIKERYGIQDYPKLGFRKVWISTSRTYPGKKGMSKINIGILGVLSESRRHRFDEYPTVAKALFCNPIKDGDVYYIKLEPNDYYLVGVLALTHEMSHFIADTLHPFRKSPTGKHLVHDVVFLKIYHNLLKFLARECYPELKKHIQRR